MQPSDDWSEIGGPPIGRLLAALPRHLVERASLVGGGEPARGASCVLYWAHHALRVDENPALELAAALAERLHLPLLVLGTLSGSHPHLSDRHATFVLEGFRDFARELGARGIPFAASLDASLRPDEALDRVASRAAVIVTEDYPAAPFPDWTASIARRFARPVVAVDTACVVPMNRVDGVFDRAFAFRDATERERTQRVPQAWPRRDWSRHAWPMVEHGFPEIRWETLDIPSVIASLEIDHSIGPVADTPGGSCAGTLRWNEFRGSRLAQYERDRNDAALPATSRMSAYLHYGMVSPFRVAREAHADGASKYLEELLVWRELAYQWCRHVPDHASIDALPSWARRTLRAHASDARTVMPRERLMFGETGDRLWDLAQHSLVAHGELHNNVRMTWGKALIGWTRSPEHALSTLIDLNNRFALDGADPASYGGLLWCLGLFDRAFSPDIPVFGTVRPRSTAEHASRLDLERFASIVHRRTRPHRVAVIGAGISGAACARVLADHGVDVTIFEKSRGAGGRMSTRRGEHGAFDHGAQYFTARDSRFMARVEYWVETGVVAPWHARFAECGATGVRLIEPPTRFVATPSMSALCAHLARDIPLRVELRVAALVRSPEGWFLSCDGRDGTRQTHGPFDAVLTTAPAPQTAQLLGPHAPALAHIATRCAMRATWSLMWASDRRVELPLDHAEVLAGAPTVGATLAWISRVSSKPGRTNDGFDRWVLLARPEWSEERLERTPEEVAPDLAGALTQLCAASGVSLPTPTHMQAHRWRFALASGESGLGSAYESANGLGIAGDWMRGTRIEDAYLSGVSLAGRFLCESAVRVQRGVVSTISV